MLASEAGLETVTSDFSVSCCTGFCLKALPVRFPGAAAADAASATSASAAKNSLLFPISFLSLNKHPPLLQA